MTVATYNSLTKAITEDSDLSGVELVPFSDLTDDQRSFKDSDELVLLQRAIDASDIAMEKVCPTIAEGMTEREVAWRMEMAMRDAGADGISFDTIVAAGPNGAMAHHMPTDKVIKRGEPIVIDMGAKVGGYCSDITRTVVVGEPDEMFHKIYNIVLDAQLTAIKDVKVGMNGEEADKLARDVIADAGYGDNFGHSLGHGVGLAVHEIPAGQPSFHRSAGCQLGLHRRARHLPLRLGRRAHRGHRYPERQRRYSVEQSIQVARDFPSAVHSDVRLRGAARQRHTGGLHEH